MVKKVALLLFAAIFLSAGALDFVTLKKAKEAYEKGEYKKAASLYEKIAEEGSDEAKFNAADALYKAGDYKGALKMFESVASTGIKFEKLHNMGNCHAKLGEIDKAIKAYEEALKIKDDKDTRFNLELLKKLKRKRQEKKKSQESQEKNGRNRSGKNDSGKKRQNREQSGKNGEKNSEKKLGNGGTENEQKKSDGDMKQKKAEEERQKSGKRKESAKMGRAETKKEPISEMELRKWNKELNRRKIQTLMLPLETKPYRGEENEETPW